MADPAWSSDMEISVCYDISPDRRRRRLFRALARFLEPVQKSVFRGDLDREQETRLVSAIRAVIAPEDDVRLINIARGDERLFGCAVIPASGRALVVA